MGVDIKLIQDGIGLGGYLLGRLKYSWIISTAYLLT